MAAGSRAWADLLVSDFPTRAAALADEIAQAHPDVVGLQEVTLWRDQVPGDVLTQPAPDATHVAFDYLALLREELRARGTAYTAVVTSTGADVEFPRQDPAAGLVDVRLTDRDVLLVRSDRVRRASNPGRGHYTAQFSEPSLTALVASTRSWTSVDYRAGRDDRAGAQHPPGGRRARPAPPSRTRRPSSWPWPARARTRSSRSATSTHRPAAPARPPTSC